MANQVKVYASIRKILGRHDLLKGMDFVFEAQPTSDRPIHQLDFSDAILDELSNSLGSLRLQADIVLPALETNPSVACISQNRLLSSGGNCSESISVTPLACPMQKAAEILWHHITSKKNSDTQKSFRFVRTSKPNSVERNCMTSLPDGENLLVNLDGVNIVRMLEEGNQIVLVGTTTWFLPTGGLQFEHHHWTIITPSPTDPLHASVVRSCYQLRVKHVGTTSVLPMDFAHVEKVVMESFGGKLRNVLQLQQTALLEKAHPAFVSLGDGGLEKAVKDPNDNGSGGPREGDYRSNDVKGIESRRNRVVEGLAVKGKKTAADAFVKLKLDQGVDQALSSQTLSNYVDMINKKYPDGQVSVLGMLTAKYGEVAVAEGLVTAKLGTRSKDIATKLQTKQLRGWLNSNKSVKDVFMLLRNGNDDALFAIRQKVEILDEYIKLFNAKNPQHKADLFGELRDAFGGEDKLAVVVSKAVASTPAEAFPFQKVLFKRWISEDYDPMSILTKVFKVPANNLASATSEMKLVTNQYRPIYNRANGIQEPTVVNPRRV
ncbi:hypothetical protein PI126_g18329 [Phytophthora idaei]|nr:hypothetical protein PI126_g18329 [Phytophthora idaei]